MNFRCHHLIIYGIVTIKAIAYHLQIIRDCLYWRWSFTFLLPSGDVVETRTSWLSIQYLLTGEKHELLYATILNITIIIIFGMYCLHISDTVYQVEDTISEIILCDSINPCRWETIFRKSVVRDTKDNFSIFSSLILNIFFVEQEKQTNYTLPHSLCSNT